MTDAEEGTDVAVAAIGGEEILAEIVGADAEKIYLGT